MINIHHGRYSNSLIHLSHSLRARMRALFFAEFYLPQLFVAVVHISFAVGTHCTCDNIGSVVERFFVPETNTPLDQGCLNVATEPGLQNVHDSAEPRLAVCTHFQNLLPLFAVC